MLYFAYGSNLNLRQMGKRCPDAKPLHKITLPDSELVFRGVADCAYAKGKRCPGALWKITKRCERVLDLYEGVGSGLYRKEYVDLKFGKQKFPVLIYTMNDQTVIMPPTVGYLETVAQGYQDFNLDLDYLEKAVRESLKPEHQCRRIRRRKKKKIQPIMEEEIAA